MTDQRHDDGHEDGSFMRDLARLQRRRAALGLLAAGGVGAAVWGFGRAAAGGEANLFGTAADGTQCLKLPSETAGPFPADGTNRLDGATVNVLTEAGVMRRDLRGGIGGQGPVADGVPMDLELALVDVGRACAPMAGLAVYLWHCDAAGVYSIYGAREASWLRGMQESDASGIVRFTTIFPGTYRGRWPHMHFEVFASADAAVSGRAALLTSQIALPAEPVAAVYAGDVRYAVSRQPFAEQSLSRDMVFSDNTPEQLGAQMLRIAGGIGSGLKGRVVIGLQPA